MADTIYNFSVKDTHGNDVSMSDFKNKDILIVNVASKCGFTPQYEELEKIFQEGKDRNLVVIGFPCNQFGHQEPGSNEEIQEFCKMNYGVSFPIMSKVEVNGKNANPLYQFLKSSQKGLLGSEAIKWNFTKFWVGKDGVPVKRYAPQVKPSDIWKEISEAK